MGLDLPSPLPRESCNGDWTWQVHRSRIRVAYVRNGQPIGGLAKSSRNIRIRLGKSVAAYELAIGKMNERATVELAKSSCKDTLQQGN